VAELADYLDLTVSQARQQFRELKLRSPVSSGRQAVFLPVETLLCLAVSYQVSHRRFGGSTAHLAPEPIPSLARLFSRPPSSILAKMANLDGSRSHGGKHDILAGAVLRDEPAHFTRIYRTLMTAARAEGIGADRLPDFLGLEHDGEFDLLGQDELGPSALENAFKDQIAKAAAEGTWTEQQTERILLAAARVGQHLFAQGVLSNCGQRCVFCGLKPASFGARRMLVAGHIKPWKDSTSAERMDLRNGLAACPSHDVAFDTGLLTVDVSLQVHVSGALAGAVRADPLAWQYYGRPPLRDTILLPHQAQPPGRKYLDWHRTNIFVA
jgi:putative restriction endonuclease